MNTIVFERVSGESGEDALYDLYSDDQLIGKSVTISEVVAHINEAYVEDRSTDDV